MTNDVAVISVVSRNAVRRPLAIQSSNVDPVVVVLSPTTQKLLTNLCHEENRNSARRGVARVGREDRFFAFDS